MAEQNKFAYVLGQALGSGRAVGAFTCYNFEGIQAVMVAAEARRAPAIVLISPSSFKSRYGERLVRGFRAVAEDSTVEILLQLDHVSDPRLIERAFECGIDAVMADGSKLPYKENLAFTRSIVSMAKDRGIGVEAELGRIEGGEDEAREVAASSMTDPEEEQRFREDSDVDCLAIAVGNVHGHYSGTPELDWRRLEEIRARDPLPLSLHGASGLAEMDLQRAVSMGIAKLNVNTELRAAYFGCLERELESSSATLNLKHLGDQLTEAVSKVVDEKLAAFGWPEKGAS